MRYDRTETLTTGYVKYKLYIFIYFKSLQDGKSWTVEIVAETW